MIQELHLGASGSNSLLGDPKISFHGSAPHLPQHSSPSLTSSTPTNNTNTTNSPSSTSENQNNNNNNSNNNSSLRCPRCDSANTKFCYYNNYNLTQPRHFCKTCRRYWTKGGALRNVPIGGGCRKSKNSSNILASSKSSSGNKFLKAIPPEIIASGFDVHDLPPNPILWGSSSNNNTSHHHHHLLALLRSATSQNPNPSPNPSHHTKKESAMMSSTEPLVSADHLGHHHQLLPSLGLSTNSMWRSSNQPQQQNGAVLSGHDLGMQELYQRLVRSSAPTNYNLSDHSPLMLSNAASSSSSSMLDQSAPALGGELGYGSWNAAFSWSDLSTISGAYP